MMLILLEMLSISIIDMSLKFTDLRLQLHFPGADELTGLETNHDDANFAFIGVTMPT